MILRMGGLNTIALRVQVFSNHIHTQNLYYTSCYQSRRSPIIGYAGYMDPSGRRLANCLNEFCGPALHFWMECLAH